MGSEQNLNNLKIVSWNVNGIRSILKKGFLDFLGCYQPDIICLQEAKIQQETLAALVEQIGPYNVYGCYAKKAGYSGVVTLAKDRLPKANCLFFILGAPFDEEGRVIAIELGGLLVINAYFPSGTTGEVRQKEKYRFLDIFCDKIGALSRRPFVLCGDFNICHQEIDIHHPKIASDRNMSGFQPAERAWFSKFLEKHELTDAFRYLAGPSKQSFTWWTYRAGARGKNLGWRIDYQIISKPLIAHLKKVDILESIHGSDHCPLLLELRDCENFIAQENTNV